MKLQASVQWGDEATSDEAARLLIRDGLIWFAVFPRYLLPDLLLQAVMNTATDTLKLEKTADSNLAKSNFASCPGCGDPAGVPAWKDDMMGDSVFLFEKRKVKWWHLIQKNRHAADCIVVPDILHFCLRCGLLWGRLNPKDANSKVRNSGSERLHQKLGWLPVTHIDPSAEKH